MALASGMFQKLFYTFCDWKISTGRRLSERSSIRRDGRFRQAQPKDWKVACFHPSILPFFHPSKGSSHFRGNLKHAES